jgi:hypothetical protein
MQSTDASSSNGDETGRLELVEQAMEKVAAHHSPDIPLLGKLDRLRTAVRQESNEPHG